MASSDFTFLTGSLDAATVARGESHGFTPPNGGGAGVYGFNSLQTTLGVVGLFCNLTNFAPIDNGGSVSAAMKRGAGGGATNFAPFIFLGLQGPAVTDTGYILGLADANPSHVVLRKGVLTGGLPDIVAESPPVQGVLRRSTGTKAIDEWVHLKLEAVRNTNGDVVLNCYENDLAAHTVDPGNVNPPVWVAIPGMTQFIDDSLGVNSGSVPYTSGRAGWGCYSKDITRRAYFDAIRIERQL